MAEYFPRTKDLPAQSPPFWVAHKDRYLRQLLIRDIQSETKRELIAYFTDCDHSQAQIDQADDVAFSELLLACVGKPVDLLLETNGGYTDATEKICSLLRQSAPDLRVIVPRRAKSNGTVIALCGSEILMGQQSELGPIDPHLAGIPAEFIVTAPPGSYQQVDVQFANAFRSQTMKLAKTLLTTGMMSASTKDEIDQTVKSLATKEVYHSHGSTIDADEAINLKLNVKKFAPADALWQKIWLLRSMYQYDCSQQRIAKIFESATISTSVANIPPPKA